MTGLDHVKMKLKDSREIVMEAGVYDQKKID